MVQWSGASALPSVPATLTQDHAVPLVPILHGGESCKKQALLLQRTKYWDRDCDTTVDASYSSLDAPWLSMAWCDAYVQHSRLRNARARLSSFSQSSRAARLSSHALCGETMVKTEAA